MYYDGIRLLTCYVSNFFVAIDGSPPKVSINGRVAKQYDSIKVSPGEKIHLVCEGDVGKPRIPIFWLLNEIPKPARLLGEKDGVKQGEKMFVPQHEVYLNAVFPLIF
jgi:hypothetical protein